MGVRHEVRSNRGAWRVEVLEVRALMATFQMPTLDGLGGGRNAAASFERMVGSLQAQIAIQAPRDTAPEAFVRVVDEVVGQYEAASASAFARNPRLVDLLRLQGETTRQAVRSLKLQHDEGLIGLSTFHADAFQEIQELTLSRDVWPVGTPLQTFFVLARESSDDLAAVATVVQASTTIAQESAAAVLRTEAAAFQSEVLLATMHQPQVSAPVVRATTTLIAQVDAAVGEPDFASRIALATAGFADALVNPGGVFGPGGSIGRRYPQLPTVPDPLSIQDAATFDRLQYRQIRTTETTVLHRNYSSSANRYGRFMSTETFASPAEAIRRLALDQSWYGTNQASFVQDVSLPPGLTIYVGRVAPIYQGIFRREARPSLYPGGAPQYLVADTRAPGIVWYDFRATGT
jgi:hypothetical protein